MHNMWIWNNCIKFFSVYSIILVLSSYPLFDQGICCVTLGRWTEFLCMVQKDNIFSFHWFIRKLNYIYSNLLKNNYFQYVVLSIFYYIIYAGCRRYLWRSFTKSMSLPGMFINISSISLDFTTEFKAS